MAKRRADVALSKKLEIFKNCLALLKCSQRFATQQFNISLDKMHEFERPCSTVSTSPTTNEATYSDTFARQ